MLLSLFTPTHHPTFIHDTYRSIQRQSWTNWEWVIVPNGPKASVPDTIRQDPRVRVVEGVKDTGIGALKRIACDHCRGDVLIEMDHDDMLVPGVALSAIARQAQAGAGFIYSDDAVFKTDFSSHVWDRAYGWESYPVRVYGRTLQAMRAFEETPRAISEIYYAPDHVRCWSRSAYYKAGGHDRTLAVGDDHDLVCRTYLLDLPFSHTGGCHYLYRWHDNNTVWANVDAIRKQTLRNRRTYLSRMIHAWCRRNKHTVLDMSDLIRDGWKWDRDLAHGLGYDLGCIVCKDHLQFCPPRLFTTFMNKAYDALLPGGYLEIHIPTSESRAGCLHPQAPLTLNYTSFYQFCRKGFSRDPEQYCRFQFIQNYEDWPSDFHREHDIRYTTLHLMAIKQGRYAGTKHI